MEYYEKINYLRKTKGVTLREFKAAGVPPMTLLRIEKGTSRASVNSLKKIAEALGVELQITFINKRKKRND